MATPPRSRRVYPAVGLVTGGGRILPSPANFYLTGEDRLRIVCVNALAGCVIGIRARVAVPNGDTIAHAWSHTPLATRSTTVEQFELGEGALLNVTVLAIAGAPVIGQTFVVVELIRGSEAGGVTLATLLAGYLTAVQPLGFPGSPIGNSLDGRGAQRLIVGSTPLPGTPINEVVPTGARWELLTLSATLSNAAGINVIPELFFDDGVVFEHYRVRADYQPAWALAQVQFVFGAGHPTVVPTAVSALLTKGFPIGVLLSAGHRIRVGAGPLNNWSAPVYTVREWLEVG